MEERCSFSLTKDPSVQVDCRFFGEHEVVYAHRNDLIEFLEKIGKVTLEDNVQIYSNKELLVKSFLEIRYDLHFLEFVQGKKRFEVSLQKISLPSRPE